MAESDTKWNRNSNSSQSRVEKQRRGQGDELRELIILEGGGSMAPVFMTTKGKNARHELLRTKNKIKKLRSKKAALIIPRASFVMQSII